MTKILCYYYTVILEFVHTLVFFVCSKWTIFCVLFLLIPYSFTQETPQCFAISEEKNLCFRFHQKDSHGFSTLKAIEIFEHSKIVPDLFFYFYPDGSPMAFCNWKEKAFLSFYEDGNPREKLDQEHYLLLDPDDDVITECHNTQCFHKNRRLFETPEKIFEPPFSKNSLILEPGDLIFSASVSPWNGSGQQEFSHISVFLGYENGKGLALSGEIMGKTGTESLDEVFFNCYNIAILRNEKIAKAFLEQKEKLLKRKTIFCTDLLHPLFQSAKIPLTLKKDENLHPQLFLEAILKAKENAGFQTVYTRLSSFLTLEELFSATRQSTEENLLKRKDCTCDAKDFLYRLIYHQFLFQPLVYDLKRIEALVSYLFSSSSQPCNPKPLPEKRYHSAGGLPGAQKTTTLDSGSATLAGKWSELTDKNLHLYSIKEKKDTELRTKTYLFANFKFQLQTKNNQFASLQMFQNSAKIPYIFIGSQTKSTKQSHTFFVLNWKEDWYFRFEGQKLKEKRLQNIHDRKDSNLSSKCVNKLCSQENLPPVLIPETNLQTGDIIFTGSLQPYSLANPLGLTHSAIAIRRETGIFLLENDIASALKEIPLEKIYPIHSWVLLRDSRFQHVFQKFLNSGQKRKFPIPFFCANLIASLVQKMDSNIKLTTIEKNATPFLFARLADLFSVADFNLKNFSKFPTPETLKIHILKQKPSFEESLLKILSREDDWIRQTILEDFPLQPLGISAEFLAQIQEFITVAIPFEKDDTEGYSSN